MKRITTSLWLCLACAVSGASGAEPLDGSYLIEFGYANAVWGPGEEVVPEKCDERGCYSGAMSVDAAGVAILAIDMTFDSMTEGGIPFTGELAGTGRGKVKGRNGVGRLKARVPLSGTLHSPGRPDISVHLGLTFTEERDGIAQLITRSSALLFCAKGVGCTRERLPDEVEPLGSEAEDGGPWTLALELSTDGAGSITGGATASFPDGSDPIGFLVTGRYVAKTDESSLALESVAPHEGASARLVHVHAVAGASTFDAFRIKYKLCGQSGTLSLP